MTSRRNVLIGFGTLAVGAGVIGGTGAFTTVDADRDVTVAFETDSNAVLGMSAAEDLPAFIGVDEEDGEIGISIERINRNARTVVDNLVEFANNGASTITSISFTLDDDSTNAELTLVNDELDLNGGLSSGESVTGLGFIIDVRNSEGHVGEPDVSATITISAETNT